MKFKKNFLHNYLKFAPLSLSLERKMECEILSKQKFERPVLDIGCGEGLFAHILFDEKIDVGIDPNLKELGRARKYGAYRELINCSGNAIPKENKSFNTIFSNSVLEHIPEIEPVLQEAKRLLSDDGNFYVTLPTNFFDQYSIINQILLFFGLNGQSSFYRNFFNNFWRHYHFFDEKGWKELFEKNGFAVLSSIQYGSKSSCLVNDFLIPFSLPSFLIKKLFNRWTLFPVARFFFLKPLVFVFGDSLKNIDVNNGGLIFFHLKKHDNPFKK